jgi:hypothetical protein
VTVKASTLVVVGHLRQTMRCLECEVLVDLHYSIPRCSGSCRKRHEDEGLTAGAAMRPWRLQLQPSVPPVAPT